MNADQFAHAVPAPLAIVVGLLVCFCGYRILKLTLGIMGFVTAAGAGWTFGLSVAHNNTGVALICAIIAGIIGAALCVWLFFLGVFLLGAGAGAIVAAAFFNAAGTQTQPIIVVIFGVVFGLLALVMQKFMIITSTAFSGSYLVVAGALHLLTHAQHASLLWFNRLPTRPSGLQGYAALAFWIVLGLAGLSFQYHRSRGAEDAARHEEQGSKVPPKPA